MPVATNRILFPANITGRLMPHKKSSDGTAIRSIVLTMKMISIGKKACAVFLFIYFKDTAGSAFSILVVVPLEGTGTAVFI